MLVIPAIDVKDGKCVRLTQGDFNQEVFYSDDPVEVAKGWEKKGAKMLHIVDLDGAKEGEVINIGVVSNILSEVKIEVQVGGGIRDKNSLVKLLYLGVSRVILGTIVFEDETLLKELLKKYSSQIIVSLDAKNGALMKKGWLESANKDLLESAKYLQGLGVERFIFTDVIKDGMMISPNYRVIEKLLKTISVPLIVAGGISNISDIQKLKNLGIEGVILGKALYEGKLKLEDAINVS